MDKIIDLTRAYTVKLSKIEEVGKPLAIELEGQTSLNIGVGEEFSMISKIKTENVVRVIKTRKILEVKQISPKLIEIETENGHKYQIEIIVCPIRMCQN